MDAPPPLLTVRRRVLEMVPLVCQVCALSKEVPKPPDVPREKHLQTADESATIPGAPKISDLEWFVFVSNTTLLSGFRMTVRDGSYAFLK